MNFDAFLEPSWLQNGSNAVPSTLRSNFQLGHWDCWDPPHWHRASGARGARGAIARAAHSEASAWQHITAVCRGFAQVEKYVTIWLIPINMVVKRCYLRTVYFNRWSGDLCPSNNTRAVVFFRSRVTNVSVFYLMTGIDGVCFMMLKGVWHLFRSGASWALTVHRTKAFQMPWPTALQIRSNKLRNLSGEAKVEQDTIHCLCLAASAPMGWNERVYTWNH